MYLQAVSQFLQQSHLQMRKPGLDPGTEKRALAAKNGGIWVRPLLTSINIVVLIIGLWL